MSDYTGPIKNIIVVMLENRSYDNMLGWLYNPNNQPPYNQAPPDQLNLNGLTGDESNPDPNSPGKTITVANQTTQTTDPNTGLKYPPSTIPIFDPGEPFNDMAQQIYGLSSLPTSNPYDDYPPATADAMQGFTLNYAGLHDLFGHPIVPAANIPDIMNYFTPAQLPITSWLANHYAVCDQWFASAPTHTFTNRAFAHSAAPGVHKDILGNTYSLIDDPQYLTDDLQDLPSIFSQLDAVYPASAGSTPPNWKIYFHDYSISTLVTPYVYAQGSSEQNVNLAPFDTSDWGTNTPEPFIKHPFTPLQAVPTTFLDDLKNNQLPMYSFIEPRYSYNWAKIQNPTNSNHPGGSNWRSNTPASDSPPTDTADGELFLMQIYNALQDSNYWEQTLLIITYDEHGGVYDHVVPPKATPPGNNIPAAGDVDDKAADGFNFNVFGCRVPAIIVSPYIAQGSTITPGSIPYDHTSIIRTVWECFNLSTASTTSLTERDANAPSLLTSLTSDPDNKPGPIPAVLITM